jgi:hypothetical protein
MIAIQSVARSERGRTVSVPHGERDAILNELHARPFEPVTSPCRALRFAFQTDSGQMSADDDDAPVLH